MKSDQPSDDLPAAVPGISPDDIDKAYRERLYGYFLGVRLSESDADFCTQYVLDTVCRNIHKLKGPVEALSHYVIGTTKKGPSLPVKWALNALHRFRRSASTYFSRASFLKDGVSSLIGRLRAHADPLSRYLWDELGVQQGLLADLLVPSKKEREEKTRMAEDAVINMLNRVADGGSIFDEQRFAGVRLSPETQALRNSSVLDEDHFALNRLLLGDAYPRQIKEWFHRRHVTIQADGLPVLSSTREILAAAGEVIRTGGAGGHGAVRQLMTVEDPVDILIAREKTEAGHAVIRARRERQNARNAEVYDFMKEETTGWRNPVPLVEILRLHETLSAKEAAERLGYSGDNGDNSFTQAWGRAKTRRNEVTKALRFLRRMIQRDEHEWLREAHGLMLNETLPNTSIRLVELIRLHIDCRQGRLTYPEAARKVNLSEKDFKRKAVTAIRRLQQVMSEIRNNRDSPNSR